MGKIFILAAILDVIYQLKFQGTLYPGEILIVALVLAIVPYLALRGPVNRVVRLCDKKMSFSAKMHTPAGSLSRNTHGPHSTL